MYLGSVISDKLANEIVDQLVPASVRGKESKTSAILCVIGTISMTSYDDENLAVTFYGDTKRRSCNRHTPRRWRCGRIFSERC
jgi:hypothetical protein